MKSIRLLALAVLAFSIHLGGAAEGEKPVVYVPVPPYVYLFEQLAGDAIEVRAIVEKGDDPHDYSPTPQQLVSLSKSRLICAGELGFEANFFVKVGDGTDAPEEFTLLGDLELLEGFCDHPSHRKDADPAEVGEHHDHEDLNDPHVWLSPKMLERVATRAAGKLKEIVPGDSEKIEANLTAFREQLKQTDKQVLAILKGVENRKFYVFHGAFAYFAQDYDLEQIAVESGNRQPTAKHVARMAKQAKEEGISTIFVQPQFDPSSAVSLAETIGGKVAILDPLEKDVLANILRIAEAIARR